MREEEEKKVITREKHLGRLTQGHKLAALMKKRKEEILCSKEQSKEQFKEQFKKQSQEQSKEQSNRTYVYGVGVLVVLVIDVCVFFAYPRNKKQANEKKKESNTKTTSYDL